VQLKEIYFMTTVTKNHELFVRNQKKCNLQFRSASSKAMQARTRCAHGKNHLR